MCAHSRDRLSWSSTSGHVVLIHSIIHTSLFFFLTRPDSIGHPLSSGWISQRIVARFVGRSPSNYSWKLAHIFPFLGEIATREYSRVWKFSSWTGRRSNSLLVFHSFASLLLFPRTIHCSYLVRSGEWDREGKSTTRRERERERGTERVGKVGE